MSFKATVLPILNGEDQPLENGVLNNCSSIRIKKTTNSFPESIVNGKYFSEYLSKIEISSGNTSVKIQQVYPGKTIDGMFHFYSIVIFDTAENTLKKIQLDEITESGITITIDNNISEIKICCYYKHGYMICTRSSSPYYGYPKILYEEEGVSKVTDQIILRSDISNKFWICENKAGEYAVDFKNWTIYLYKFTFDTEGNLTGEEEVTHTLYTGKDFLLSSIDLFTNFDRIELEKNLVLVRNEHIIRLTDLEETEIYTTYKNNLQAGECCFLMLVADYTTKNVPIVFWRRNSGGYFKKKYMYATDLKTKTLSSSEIPTKTGYNFDGYYINPRTESDEGIKPSDESTLHNHSNYRKIVDSNGNFIKNVSNFSADNDACNYINIRPGKYAYANYTPKTTTITLKWNIQPVSGSKIYINGGNTPISQQYTTKTITETYDKECFQLSTQQINIPTVTETKQNYTIKWNFAGFYSDEGCTKEVINKEGIFLRYSDYTTNKKWKSDKSNLTLYAKWVKDGWIELDKTGNAPEGYYGKNGSPSFSQVYGAKLPNDSDFYIPALYDEDTGVKDEDWNFGGYWTFDEKGNYKEQITSKGGGFRLNTEISNAIRLSKLEGSITIHAYWYGDKFKIDVKSSDKDMGSVSGRGKYRKGETATLKATVKDSNKFIFLGWKKEGKSSVDPYDSTSSTFSPSVTGKATYIAYFGIKTYKINYKDLGGGNCTAENKFQLTPFSSYWGETKIIDGVKKGYNFLGWYDSTETTKYTEINEPVTKDMTLYAKWKENSYTITLSPGIGSFPSSSYIKLSNIKYGNVLTDLASGAIPSKEGYTFKGFYYDNFKYIDKDGKWIKNTGIVDSNGCSIIKTDITLTANYSKNVTIKDTLGFYFTNIIDIKAEKLNNVVFNKPIANKIATTKWINTTFGEPENNNYCDAQKDFYTQNNQNEYKSNKVVADKHFCYDFDFTDTKCLKQTTVQQMFNNSNKNKCNVYLRSITSDIQNNKTILRMSFKNAGGIKYPITEQIPIYITINDNHIYKLLLDSTINVNSVNKDYIDVELDNLVETIGKITIKHVPCFAIKNSDNTSETKYYMPYIVFYKYTDLTNLVIEKDTILDNVEIKEYDSDTLEVVPSFPGGSIVV